MENKDNQKSAEVCVNQFIWYITETISLVAMCKYSRIEDSSQSWTENQFTAESLGLWRWLTLTIIKNYETN